MALVYENIKMGIKLMAIIYYFVSIADGNVVPTADDNIGNMCEPITVSMCKYIGYTMTQFSNSLGHTNQDDAGLEVH